MKIKFMGTAAGEGWPGLFCKCEACQKARELGGRNIRKRTCTMVDDNILIDFGPDILSHVHKHSLDLTALDAIIITHSHEDHLYPSDLHLARPPFGYFERESKIMLCGNRTVHDICVPEIKEDALLEFKTAVPFEVFKAGDYIIHPLLAQHSYDYEDSLIYAVEKEGRFFLNGNDTNYFPEETWDYMKDMRFAAIALDTNNGAGHADPIGKAGHMNIEMVKKVKARLLEVGCADEKTLFVMNHFSHNGALMHHELEEVGEAEGFEIAYDGLDIEI
jgi:phosphoribosyl 1,2-cyclic phosphate phosphodiesterase